MTHLRASASLDRALEGIPRFGERVLGFRACGCAESTIRECEGLDLTKLRTPQRALQHLRCDSRLPQNRGGRAATPHLQLLEDIVDMVLHRGRADFQLPRNLLV
jgi:hypothetical protein